jgi:hypothetical protein
LSSTIQPVPFASGITRDVEDARRLLASALRLCGQAHAALGPGPLIDPVLRLRSHRLEAAHAFITYAAADLSDALDQLRPLAEQEGTAVPPPGYEARTLTALDQADSEG